MDELKQTSLDTSIFLELLSAPGHGTGCNPADSGEMGPGLTLGLI